MNKEDILVKLHAYVASDGIIDTWKCKETRGNNVRVRKRLRVRFYNGEKTLVDDFINSAKKVYSNKKYVTYSPKRFEIEVRGQIICKKILSLGDVSTKNWEVPKNLTKKQKAIWIRAFADCDGTVGHYNYHRYVAIDSINLKGLNQISKVLDEFRISSRIQEVRYKGKISYRLKISRKGNLSKFNKLIGFNSQQKKKKLLEAIKSYKQNILKTKLII